LVPAGALGRKFEILARVVDERTRRLVAAAEAQAIGFSGVTAGQRLAARDSDPRNRRYLFSNNL